MSNASEGKVPAAHAVLTVEETAEHLKVHASTVRKLCHLAEGQADRIPNFRLGNAIRIPYWALIEWEATQAGCRVPSSPAKPSPVKRRRRMIAPQPRRRATKGR